MERRGGEGSDRGGWGEATHDTYNTWKRNGLKLHLYPSGGGIYIHIKVSGGEGEGQRRVGPSIPPLENSS